MTSTERDKTTIPGVQSANEQARRDGQDRILGPHDQTGLGPPDTYTGGEASRQVSDLDPRPSEEDIQREELGPRGEPGQDDPATMTPQRAKKTPQDCDPGHTA